MDYQNPYTPPSSDLLISNETGEIPTIEEALSRGYDFNIGDVISEAWTKVKGFKLNCFLAILIVGAASLVFSFIPFIGPVAFNFIISPVLSAGLLGMAIIHYHGRPTEIKQLFNYFHLALPIFLYSLISSLIIILGFILLIIPGIYLTIAYTMTLLIMINHQELSFWEAMEASRKAITQHWFKFFGLMFLTGLINIGGALLLGIGLIWTIPLSYIAIIIVYETIFGARQSR